MRYWIYHHQHKGKPFVRALNDAGWEYSRRPQVVLLDTSHNHKIIEMYLRMKATIVLYPHTSTAAWWYDGIMELHPGVSAMLCIGEGQREVQKIITPDLPTYAVGWGYTPIEPFRKPGSVRRILFAPIHPSGKVLRPEAKETNAAVFRELLKLEKTQIVVRYLGALEANGLWDSPKVIWKPGKANGDYGDILGADLVIAEGMFLHMAVALGKPAIGLNQRVPPRANRSLSEPANWGKYNALQAYPIDYADSGIIGGIDRALTYDETVDTWKRRFIGDPLSPRKLTNVLEDIYARNSESPYMGTNPAGR